MDVEEVAIMSIELTEQQQQTLDALGMTPVRVIDPRTSNAYVLIPAAEYEAVREALEDERQQRAIRAVALRNAADKLGEEFGRLAAEWKSQSEFLASPTAIAGLPAYRAIIEMGQAAVPLILGELRREPDHWFVALKRITGEDPVPEDARGEIDRMAEAWLSWGHVHGIES
jgi:PHD/YefM family antitoxin component YafN of YafNO toxin-antitoxin module